MTCGAKESWINMIEHVEKENIRYVIATFDHPTSYVVVNGGHSYSFIDNVEVASKFTTEFSANIVANDIIEKTNIDLVVLKLCTRYVLCEEE